MAEIKIQPMEEWLEDRMDLLQAKIVADLEEDDKTGDGLVEEYELLKTILGKLKGE